MDYNSSPSIRVEEWSEVFVETPIFFMVYWMEGSIFIWIGDSQGNMNSLISSVKTPFDSLPSVSTLQGSPLNFFGSNLARRLAIKSKKLCFVSYNIPKEDSDMLQAWCEKKLLERLKQSL